MKKNTVLIIIPILVAIVLISGCTSSNTTSDNSTSTSSSSGTSGTVLVKIITTGNWSGSVGDGSTSKSIDGTGNYQQDMGSASIVSATIQKKSNSTASLTVQIIKNGQIVKQESTTAQYGVVSVSASV